MNRIDIQEELRRAQADFHQLVAQATPQDLRRPSNGTRWTNRQLMWHMVFGYLIVRTLMPLVHLLGRRGWSRRFAATLNVLHRPFHLINYAGSAGGGLLLPPRRMAAIMDITINALDRRLGAETPAQLALTMHFPTRWDPYFRDTMSVLDVYHYGTEHYDHHHRQLTLQRPTTGPPRERR
jgi:heme/copper-type cytochrome/quinol oxidase subunit 1